MKRSCISCDRRLRRSLATKAHVLTVDGKIVVGLVCARCVSRAIKLVTPPTITLPPPCSECGRAVASVCATCFLRVCNNVSDVVGANVQLKAIAGVCSCVRHVDNDCLLHGDATTEERNKDR